MRALDVRKTGGRLLLTVVTLASAMTAQAVTMDTVVIGDVNNSARADNMVTSNNISLNGYGAVSYAYRIGMYEVTIGQYVEFLNSVARYGDPNTLFSNTMMSAANGGIIRSGSGTTANPYLYSPKTTLSDWAQMPVVYVNVYDALRFANWMENGQPNTGFQTSSTTEDGSYAFTDSTTVGSRKAGAHWVLASVNEWMKAAYYDPRTAAQGGPAGDDHYWKYGTASDADPVKQLPPGGTNSANYDRVRSVISGGVPTAVGSYADSHSYYGLYDAVGNVFEWTETTNAAGNRATLSSSFTRTLAQLTEFQFFAPGSEASNTGFRLVYIPEPATLGLLALPLLWLGRRSRWQHEASVGW